nr:hypothetical protein [Enterovibrio coralii]
MNIGNVGYSQHTYAKPTSVNPVNQEAKANQAKEAEGAKQSYEQVAKEVLKVRL